MNISFDCPKCGKNIEDDIEDTAYDHSGENVSDCIGYVTSTTYCECSESFNISVTAEAHRKSVRVDENPDVLVKFHDNTYDFDYDIFLDEYMPLDAYEVYEQSIAETKSLETASYMLGIPGQPLLKVLYLQYVVILEAYLSDRLIKIVLNDDAKMLNLINSTAALRETTHSLAEIAKDPLLVKKTVKNYLQRVSFHDLGKVAAFYDSVLGVYIFADNQPEKVNKRKKKDENLIPAEERQMSDIIQVRHHLVHRNGRDNEGEFVPIELEQVEQVSKLVNEMVKRIERAYIHYNIKRHADIDDQIPY